MKAVFAFTLCSLFTLQCFAQTCPEQLDDQKRKTLTLSLKIDKYTENEALYEKQHSLDLSVEKLHIKRVDLSEQVGDKWKKMYEDAEKRTVRGWYEHPVLWVSIGIALTLAVIGGGFGIVGWLNKTSQVAQQR